MKKSSLGRRSSTNIPIRIPSLGASGQRRCSAEKRSGSLLRQPGFSSSKRSQSEDRESYGGRTLSSTMVRSSTVSSMSGRSTMTPVTPAQSYNANLPTGSARPHRTQTMSTDSNRRISSFGGTKNTRKDSRPISEKPFQQLSQSKVQQYLDIHGAQFLGPNIKIRPMNTKLFVEIMNVLFMPFDSRIVITNSNYIEELPVVLRKFGYRAKVERSWLMTVNTTHAWQYVLAVLSWLVDAIECMDSVNEFEMMYSTNLSNSLDDKDEDEGDDFKITKDVVLHLKKTFRFQNDPNVDLMDSDYIEKMIIDLRCTEEDLAELNRETDSLKSTVENEEQKQAQHLETLEKLKTKESAFLSDIQSVQAYVQESKEFIQCSQEKKVTLEQEIADKKIALEKKQEELQGLKEKVSSQQISLDDKDKLVKEKTDLYRIIQFHEKAIREYENSTYVVDMKSAENQRQLEKLIVEYNKLVAEKIIVEPRLKDAEVKFTLLNKADKETMDIVNCHLKSLKEEYKSSLRSLEAEQEEASSVLWRVKQDIKETEEQIAKESTLLEGVECDLEKQEELINKESNKLKEEANRYQKMTKEIIEEIALFDLDRLQDKKNELKILDHDYELLQSKIKLLLEAESAVNKECCAILKEVLDKRNQKVKEFQKKHLEE